MGVGVLVVVMGFVVFWVRVKGDGIDEGKSFGEMYFGGE